MTCNFSWEVRRFGTCIQPSFGFDFLLAFHGIYLSILIYFLAPGSMNPLQCWSKEDDCDHIFHEDCIVAWLNDNDDCPLCRAKLVRSGTGGDEEEP